MAYNGPGHLEKSRAQAENRRTQFARGTLGGEVRTPQKFLLESVQLCLLFVFWPTGPPRAGNRKMPPQSSRHTNTHPSARSYYTVLTRVRVPGGWSPQHFGRFFHCRPARRTCPSAEGRPRPKRPKTPARHSAIARPWGSGGCIRLPLVPPGVPVGRPKGERLESCGQPSRIAW